MTTAVENYVELLESQLLERAAAGGGLSQDREGEYVEQFDLLWRGMSPQEQDAVEVYLTSELAAPEDLAFIDVEVAEGHVPRRAA
jgi:hypothetical protein